MATTRKTQALSAAKTRTLTTPGMYSDGNGLYLRVEPSGSKHWVQRVTIAGKRRHIGLGSYPAVSLAEARDTAADHQRAIREGRDPIAAKRQAAEGRRRPPIPTFAHAAHTVIDLRSPTWTNAKHASQWTNTLSTYVFPVLGKKLVDDITSGDVLTVLTPNPPNGRV